MWLQQAPRSTVGGKERGKGRAVLVWEKSIGNAWAAECVSPSSHPVKCSVMTVD